MSNLSTKGRGMSAPQKNKSHPNGSMTLDNAAVQRLIDYGVLRFTDNGWQIVKPEPRGEQTLGNGVHRVSV